MCPDTQCLERLAEDFGNLQYKTMSGLSLAFIGDAVYELLVRKYVLSLGEAKVSELHRSTVEFVNAAFQAKAAEVLMPEMTEVELSYYKRGRNANSAHTPKNKSEAEYHKSTGFEALFGYLFLAGEYERLSMFFSMAVCGDDK